MADQQPVLFSHDGGVDDYLSTVLLLTMDHVRVLGVVVTEADCYLAPAVSATRKILDLMGRSEVPVAASTVRGLNPFPRIFRRDAFSVDHFPILNDNDGIQAPLVDGPGQNFMARVLREAPEPVTILETGPVTTLVAALEQEPALAAKIKEIYWMAGAFDVPGNVDPIIEGGQDMTAEWNVYWDPIAAHRLWQTDIPVTMCPLDITNNVKVTSEFVRTIARNRRYPLSDFAGQCYALVTHQDYYFWDVLTTAYLGRPDLFTTRELETGIIPTGVSQGRTIVRPGGKQVRVLATVDKPRFYEYMLQSWAQ
jgi:purine nucleosidase